ncbi:PH domain-containing protein [Sporosarcina sp. G11-34]|uniref:PH domain-containing protein n=1 Tax=Sporosarcina sp. G11-34 TaxID=2849605 RepID=UPI0022A90786|nr:PH domain-containing protein [Sporosarcina sp. G11-34]MCZ2259599.1 PH domain-containing protein [Sporosarcina sp. G11-34]
MNQTKRYNPLIIIFDLWSLIKNSFFFVLFLFVLRYGSDSTFIKYGRIAFFIFFGLTIISIILKWFTHKYKLDDVSFHIYKGLFNKSEQTIPFSKIQNVQRRTSLLHRLLGVTSITFETGISQADTSVKFEVLSRNEADQIEEWASNSTYLQTDDVEIITAEEDQVAPSLERTIHFTPTKKDDLKASFTSLSFLVLIPILLSIYFKVTEIFKVEDKVEGIFSSLMSTWWIVALIVIVLVLASVLIGIVRTFMRYGKYEISSDDSRVYIAKGVLDESTFSILKNRVQAIEIIQSPMKRMLGLAEVKLISAGGVSFGEEALETNSLYPFLPVKRAYEMIQEVLPTYEVIDTMTRLPRTSFWIRIMKPSWFWIIVTVTLFYFKPPIFNIDQAWWMVSAGLLLLIATSRILEYFNTRYILNGEFIQFKTGSFETSVFISKRTKIVEVKVSRSKFQQLLGLASIGTINHAKPFHHASVENIPVEMADAFYTWYAGRVDQIELE